MHGYHGAHGPPTGRNTFLLSENFRGPAGQTCLRKRRLLGLAHLQQKLFRNGFQVRPNTDARAGFVGDLLVVAVYDDYDGFRVSASNMANTAAIHINCYGRLMLRRTFGARSGSAQTQTGQGVIQVPHVLVRAFRTNLPDFLVCLASSQGGMLGIMQPARIFCAGYSVPSYPDQLAQSGLQLFNPKGYVAG